MVYAFNAKLGNRGRSLEISSESAGRSKEIRPETITQREIGKFFHERLDIKNQQENDVPFNKSCQENSFYIKYIGP